MIDPLLIQAMKDAGISDSSILITITNYTSAKASERRVRDAERQRNRRLCSSDRSTHKNNDVDENTVTPVTRVTRVTRTNVTFEKSTHKNNDVDEAVTEKNVTCSKMGNILLLRNNIYAHDLFEQFWLVYPKKVSKGRAFKNYKAAIKAGAKPEDIIAGAKRYAEERKGKDHEYTKYPDGWLSAERWKDEAGNSKDSSAPYDRPRGVDRSIENLTKIVEYWVSGKIKTWPKDHYGPQPGHEGCTIPEEILAAVGRTQQIVSNPPDVW